MSASHSASNESQRSVAQADAPISILLVDDDPKNLLALESILDTPEHRLVKVQTADDALLALMPDRRSSKAIGLPIEADRCPQSRSDCQWSLTDAPQS